MNKKLAKLYIATTSENAMFLFCVAFLNALTYNTRHDPNGVLVFFTILANMLLVLKIHIKIKEFANKENK